MVDPNFKIKTEVDKPNYGKFYLEPLEQGYGQTLGNSLRRVLLTSLPGAAITSVKIEGVMHQFSTVPGLKEDIVEFALNLKKVRLMMSSDEPVKLSLVAQGPGEIKASDIEVPAGVTIVNPDLVLGTLADKKAKIEAEFTAEKGYGYVPVEEKHMDEIGRMFLDAIFSPVLRVNYRVEATRVGRMTNLDRLVMEVWTDGSLAPLDAIKSAAKILVNYLSQVYEPRAAIGETAPQIVATVSEEFTKMRIEEFDIPTRIVNALSNGNIETVGQLLSMPRNELIKIKNLGAKSLAIVEDKLKEKGINLPV